MEREQGRFAITVENILSEQQISNNENFVDKISEASGLTIPIKEKTIDPKYSKMVESRL